jgi:hypothetical protein
MRITLVYVYPHNGMNPVHRVNAERFLDTYRMWPAGEPHRMIVVSNGAEPNDRTRNLFAGVQAEFFVHDNSGYDIGAFQHVARDHGGDDLMVFFGNSAYLRGLGWLTRMRETFEAGGDLLYGSMVHGGVIPVGVWPHVRTTGFWMSPKLLMRYPILVATPQQRYPFEHGKHCLTMWLAQNGSGAVCVTFNGIYEIGEWSSIPQGYHNGKQEQMITGDRMSCPPYYPYP